MFHYECQSKNGNVLTTCLDGFLFGVCCSFKEGILPINITRPDPLDIVDNIIASVSAIPETSTPALDLNSSVLEVKTDDIENMMNSILNNVLLEFDENVEPILNLLKDSADASVINDAEEDTAQTTTTMVQTEKTTEITTPKPIESTSTKKIIELTSTPTPTPKVKSTTTITRTSTKIMTTTTTTTTTKAPAFNYKSGNYKKYANQLKGRLDISDILILLTF